MIGEVIGWRRLNGTLRSREGAAEGIGPDVEPVRVLLFVYERQHGPTIGVTRGQLGCTFECHPRWGVLCRADALEVREATEHSLVRT